MQQYLQLRESSMQLGGLEVRQAKDDPHAVSCLLYGQEDQTVLLEGTAAQSYTRRSIVYMYNTPYPTKLCIYLLQWPPYLLMKDVLVTV